MNLYFNTDSLNFVNSPMDFSPLSNVSFIFGSSQNIGVTLVNVANNGAYVLPSGYNMVLGLKPIGTFLTGQYLAYGSTNVVPDTGNGNYAYGITGFNLYTTGISGLLSQNSSITLAMELEYDNNGSGVVLSNSNTCTIENSYINLNQVPFITGNLAVYPAPNNIQTIANLGLTYVGTNQTGLFQRSGNYVLASQTGNFLATGAGGLIPSSLHVSGTLGALHGIGLSSVPSIVANAGAGTSATISISGTDTEGTITLTAGTSPSASGVIFAATFANSFAYPNASVPPFYAANANAASLNGLFHPFASGNSTSFGLVANASGLTGGSTYSFFYQVRGY